jgi:hypothetical protein
MIPWVSVGGGEQNDGWDAKLPNEGPAQKPQSPSKPERI